MAPGPAWKEGGPPTSPCALCSLQVPDENDGAVYTAAAEGAAILEETEGAADGGGTVREGEADDLTAFGSWQAGPPLPQPH